MNNISNLASNERGGAHIALFALLAVGFTVLLFVTSVQWMLQSSNKTVIKLALDRSTHAAALRYDPLEAAYGRLVWDERQGEDDFYVTLRQNLKLDSLGNPQTGSRLESAPVVHLLEFMTAPAYPAELRRTVIVNAGHETETIRNVEVTIYGPSVVAVVEVHQRVRGKLEPIVLSSVASVRFR